MDKSKSRPLKELAHRLKKEGNPKNNFTSLVRAFELFSAETDRLEGAYNSLKEEFTSIHGELESTNAKLTKKVAELGVMTFYFESIISNIAQGLLFIDLNGDVTTYNNAAEKILGVPSKKVLYTSFWQNFEDNLFGVSIRESLANKTPPPAAQVTYMNVDSERRELEVTLTYVQEEGKGNGEGLDGISVKKLEGIIVLFRDITDVRNLQILAARNDRMKEIGEMAAMVAHEIRNPLGGIKGFASLLRRDLENSPEQKQMADNIISGTDTLNRLVTNVLNYSRQITPEKIVSDILPIVKELKTYFDVDTTKAEGRPQLIIDTPLKELPLLIDQQLIKSALLNLLINASDAMPNGGTITINLDHNDSRGIIKITDQGCGIPQANLEKIFTPFFTTKPKGNGFGLAEVYKIIQAHDGDINIESIIDQGTTFTIEIPLVEKNKSKTSNNNKQVR
ncbi:MAG: ATP-binding protein [Chlamydiota bacterium]|nr:ATP-binding protein [Chlamydiota bacterium]